MVQDTETDPTFSEDLGTSSASQSTDGEGALEDYPTPPTPNCVDFCAAGAMGLGHFNTNNVACVVS